MTDCTLTLPGQLAGRLFGHLFPGDGDEHGAVIAAGLAGSGGSLRLLARELFPARDGIDYVPGKRGYRMLRGEFVTEKILYCRDAGLCYLAVHNHGGTDRVAFSSDDLASQARGYPALLDLARGKPVGALVFAEQSAAGNIWLSADTQVPLRETRVIGTRIERLHPSVPARPAGADETYDRQARLLGDAGQHLLAGATVGVIGAGGVGSLLTQYLAHLGVGRLIITDPDHVDPTNLPRLVGATSWDAMSWLRKQGRPAWLQRMGARLAAPKVRVMERLVRRINTKIRVEALEGNVVDEPIARRFEECDYLFLAADSAQARLVFNALVHQYLIPGVQIGVKVLTDHGTGAVRNVFTVSRPVLPSRGCLWCNGLISRSALQEEALSLEQRHAQRYLDEPTVIAPSVITLNGVAASQAANDFLFALTGLVGRDVPADYLRTQPQRREVWFDEPRADPDCPECGISPTSRFAMGDGASLPTRS